MYKINEYRLVIIIACSLFFCVQILGNMTAIVLPPISKTFNLTVDSVNIVNLIYLALVISLIMPLGKIISKYGVEKFLKIGISLGIISLLVSAVSPNFNIFLIGITVQGISTPLICCSIILALSSQLSGRDFGRSIGIVLSAGYVGLAFSYLFTGFIAYYLSWRILFIIMMIFYCLILFFVFKLNVEWSSKSDLKIDYKELIVYFVFMIMFVVTMSNLDYWAIFTFPFCLVLLFYFIKLERNIESPMVNLVLLRNPNYLTGNYASFVVFFTMFIVLYILNFYLQYVLDFDVHVTGLFLLPTAIIMIFVSYFVGKFALNYDLRLLSIVGCVILIFASYIIFKMDFIPIHQIFIGCIILGVGEGFFLASNNRYVGQYTDSEYFIDSSTFLFTNRELGKTISLSIYFVIAGLVFGESIHYYDIVLDFVMTGEMMMEICIALLSSVIVLLFVLWFLDYRSGA